MRGERRPRKGIEEILKDAPEYIPPWKREPPPTVNSDLARKIWERCKERHLLPRWAR